MLAPPAAAAPTRVDVAHGQTVLAGVEERRRLQLARWPCAGVSAGSLARRRRAAAR